VDYHHFRKELKAELKKAGTRIDGAPAGDKRRNKVTIS